MKRILITGGCGFIGGCLSRRLLDQGEEVIGVDNLSRPGSRLNAAELASERFTLHEIDLSDAVKTFDLFSAIGPVDAVFHLAAQVAVTSSYADRRHDFLNNATASFNVIESVKRFTPEAYCLYASTNKVYGHIEVSEPVGLNRPLSPYTPYGVSKATGELYFTEYGRSEIGLTTCALRQSCIYGHNQCGVEDQGWIAWFAIANLLGQNITIFGDGKQVRDLLFVEDLIDLYLKCWERRQSGVYPVGGGPENAVNLLQSLEMIRGITGRDFVQVEYRPMRPGDQPYFVADLSWVEQLGIDWKPSVSAQSGIRRMVAWIQDNLGRIRKALDERRA